MDTQQEYHNAITGLMAQYIQQLLSGCGNYSCCEILCDTGRRNVTPSNKPVRKYTPRSARAIALMTVSSGKPKAKLCKYMQRTGETEAAPKQESKRDPSSFIQQLADTEAVKALCTPDATFSSKHPELAEMIELYDSLRSTLVELERSPFDSSGHPNPRYLSNDAAADIVNHVLIGLTMSVPRANAATWRMVQKHVSHGFACDLSPACNIRELLDELEDGSKLAIISRVVEALSRRSLFEDVLENVRKRHPLANDTTVSVNRRSNNKLLKWTVDRLLSDSDPQVGRLHRMLTIWLLKLVTKHWNSNSTAVPRPSLACGALELLEALSKDPVSAGQTYHLPWLAGRIDADDMAESFMKQQPALTSRHLLSFPFLFTTNQLSLYFRTINHLKMRTAHSSSSKALALRQKLDVDPESDLRLEYAEEHYLLLSVSRLNILKDAFDQLWQRRQGELSRPLRVRLGETDDMEVGHDLGGVQIEFFNLICREVLADEAGMFSTLEASGGLSWFRVASVQPLYMFELFGLLVGLAVYNGISLPISMPTVFYRHLLGFPSGGPYFEDLRDGWPAIDRSLHTVLNSDDVESFGLDYSFPFEANGVRSSVPHHGLYVIEHSPDVTRSGHYPRLNLCLHEKLDDVGWPGWAVKHFTEPSEPISTKNRKRYILDYIRWLTHHSIKPQLNAFLTGFYTCVDKHSISIFSAEQLKAQIEGSSTLDIAELQRATRYDGYDPQSRYIRSFWRIVSSWPSEKQKALLKFVTAAERIPIGGASMLTFKIQKAEFVDEEDLPTSSTCFGTLSLPKYKDVRVLEEKLSLALEYGLEGFGTG